MSPYPIEFDGVQRWFGTSDVLRSLSFRVAPGTVYALLGRNGSGKTTALRILLGLLAPHRGSARLFGTDSREIGRDERARTGYVGEEHRLYPTMTVGQALDFEAGTRSRFRRAFAEQALQRCGLAMRQRVVRLSRGQRAQLSLVLAVAGDPEVLICDDPALGLDVVMRRELLDVLIDLLTDSGATVLFSSHFLSDVERIADRVGILHEGALLVDAGLDDLKQRVRRFTFAPRSGAPLPAGDDVLRARPRRGGGCDLTLLDAGPERLADLAARGELSAPVGLSLEELFLDLVGPERSLELSA